MSPASYKSLAIALFFAGASTMFAQSNDALINLLVKKGIITAEEAAEVSSELRAIAEAEEEKADAKIASVVAQNTEMAIASLGPPPAIDESEWVATSGAKHLKNITLSGRLQAQYANGSLDIEGDPNDPDDLNHFFLRRAYFGIKATFNEDWSSKITYDFASDSFDEAFIRWKHSDALLVDGGLRKAPIAYEEYLTSSGSIKPIERSAATRYFVEPNNGRRLGAGAYRQGVWIHGEQGGVVYAGAITNPERVDAPDSTGNGSNNTLAFWGHLGYGGKTETVGYRFGAAVGYLPEQGGQVLGAGDDLLVTDFYGDFNIGGWSVAAEYFWSDNKGGAVDGSDSNSHGYWIQPSYRVGALEGVLRYSYVDSDGRGIRISDGVRSWPSAGTMDKMYETFLGGNWYIKDNAVKLQAGVVFAESKDTVDGGPAKATARGFRSQLQVNY